MPPRNGNDVQWWKAGGEDATAGRLNELYAGAEKSQAYRRQMNLHHMRLYADRDLYGAGGAGGSGGHTRRYASTQLLQQRRPRMSINVVRNMCNAATSMLTRSRPSPKFLTNGGDFELQKRAKRRGRFVEGVFQKEQSYLLGQKMVQQGCILGTGAIKVVRDYKDRRVRHEPVFVGELIIDEAEAIYGKPRNLFQVRTADALVLKEIYNKEREIDQAKPVGSAGSHQGGVADQKVVIEAWHLPSGPDANDGKYAVFTEGGILHLQDYPHAEFPFAFWRWEEDPLGFFGTGIASELSGFQYEINQTIRNIQANWWSGGNMKVLLERGSKVVKSHISNDLRVPIIEYTGTPPIFAAPSAVSPELLKYLQYLVEQSYQVTGISQLSAQSQTPFASMSGRARLVHENAESQRFLTAQRRYEQAFMDLAERTMEAAGDIDENTKGGMEVMYTGKSYLEPVKYDDIKDPSGIYEIQVYPTSILPSTPAGKLSMVEALEARGYIDGDQAKKLLDFPDLQSEMDFDMAHRELIDDRIQKILDEGEYIAPHPDMDLQLALERTLKAIMHAENRGVPDAVIGELRKFRDAVQALITKASQPDPNQPPPVPPGGGGGVPAAMPGAGPMPDTAAAAAIGMGPQAAVAPVPVDPNKRAA